MNKKPKLIPFKQLRADMMKDPEFRREYQKLEPEFQIAQQIIAARIKQKLSQAQLAEKAHTGQAVISRLENMNAQPSVSLLAKIAQALNTPIQLTIPPAATTQ